MKKIMLILISLMMVVGMTACSSSKGSISGVTEDENRYVVTFDNATKDMSVSVEMTLEENHLFTFEHDLQIDDSVKVEYFDTEGNSVMDLDLHDVGGGQTYLQPGTYTVEVSVVDKANGSLTLTIDEIEDDGTNPWKTTYELQEAIDATGIDFHAPIDEALPGDVTFSIAFYTEDILQANFNSDSNGMFMRVSPNHEGKEDLAGDYNEYPLTWHEPVKGLDVTCYGEENSIRLATFSSGDLNYSINYNAYQDGPGMTVDELNSLLNGM